MIEHMTMTMTYWMIASVGVAVVIGNTDMRSTAAPIVHRRTTSCGPDGKRNAICYKTEFPIIYDHSRAVARLFINNASACSGWLVGQGNLLITNNHCISTQHEATNTEFQFMSQDTLCRSNTCHAFLACIGPTVIQGAVLLATSVEHDYALVRLNTVMDLPQLFGSLKIRDEGAREGEPIYIAQHAQAHGKTISMMDSAFEPTKIIRASYRTGALHHTADTKGGSSGSPVIARSDHKVVALHHKGGCGVLWWKNQAVDIRWVALDILRKGVALPGAF